jgi:hypothetical protein
VVAFSVVDRLSNRFFQTFAASSSVIRHTTIRLQTSILSLGPVNDQSTLALAALLLRIQQK